MTYCVTGAGLAMVVCDRVILISFTNEGCLCYLTNEYTDTQRGEVTARGDTDIKEVEMVVECAFDYCPLPSTIFTWAEF